MKEYRVEEVTCVLDQPKKSLQGTNALAYCSTASVTDARKSFMKLTADDDDVADFADEKSVDSPTQGQIQKSADAGSTDDAGDVQVSTLKKSFYSRH